MDAARFTYEAEKRSLFADLLTALADYQARKRLSELAAQRAEVAREFSSIAGRRAEAGDLSKSERLAAQLSLSQAIAEQTTARSDFSEARQALTALVGEVMPAWPVLPDPPAAAAPLDMTLVRRLPELRAAEARADALAAEIRFAKKSRIPDPTIGAAYGRDGDADFAGVRLSVPIPVLRLARPKWMKLAPNALLPSNLSAISCATPKRGSSKPADATPSRPGHGASGCGTDQTCSENNAGCSINYGDRATSPPSSIWCNLIKLIAPSVRELNFKGRYGAPGSIGSMRPALSMNGWRHCNA